tara:strand:- start:613 stop:843 length:231 start_codon:yes stop_codon:yes gene_type:complete
MDWQSIGIQARESALDAHGELVPVAIAWSFVSSNPEIFGDCDEWPDTFPETPPLAFRVAYEFGTVDVMDLAEASNA